MYCRGMTRVLHHNLLLPLQGRIRQQEGQVVEDPLGPEEEEEEEEEDSGLPSVPQGTRGRGWEEACFSPAKVYSIQGGF